MSRNDPWTSRPPHERAGVRRAALAWIHFFLVGVVASSASAVEASEARPPRGNVPIPIKILRYSQRLVEKYDRNGDGRLEQDEWSQMQGNPRLADLDRDQVITAAELAERVARYGRPRKIRLTPDLAGENGALPSFVSPATVGNNLKAADRPKPPPSQAGVAGGQGLSAGSASAKSNRGQKKRFASRTPLPRTLPSWFRLRDANGDTQITMAEFVTEASQSQFDEFASYDHNGDGVITAEECTRGPKGTGKSARQPVVQQPAKEAVKEGAEPNVDDADQTEPGQSASGSAAEKAAALKEKRLEKLRARKQKQTDKPARKSG